MKNPLVVGYKGEIGSFILQGLLRVMPKAGNIWCYDVNDSVEECDERIRKSDVIFLCVPIEETYQFFVDWTEILDGKTVIEQTSLKSYIFTIPDFKNWIKNLNLLSMHILFRPSATPNKKDRAIALINSEKWQKSGIIDTIMKITESEEILHFESYISHDKEMAVQQTLLHKVILTLDKVNSDGATYISKQIKTLADRIRAGNPKLYKIIQKSPYKDHALNKFRKELK